MNRKVVLATTLGISLAFAVGYAQRPATAAVIGPETTRVGAVISAGGWSVSGNGVLTWTTDISATVDPAYYAARSAGLAAVEADLERQINGDPDTAFVSTPTAFPPTASPAARATALDSTADRSDALARIAGELECQINGCEP